MLSLLDNLGRQPKPVVLSLGIALLVLLWLLDYFTGSELAVDILYLLPIALATWYAGRWEGQLFCVLGAAAWFEADALAASLYSHPAIPYWNASVRLGSFMLFSEILWRVRVAQNARKELMLFIVHDLRSPLTNIINGLQTLATPTKRTTKDEEKDLIQIATVSCDRLLNLIETLLDLSRLRDRKMPLHLGPASARDLEESAVKTVALWAERKHLSLVSQCDVEGQGVLADPSLTLRILVNLLSNAIQSSHPGKTVTLRVTRQDDGMVAFSVSDQGAGIPKEWTDKVFNKFGQIEARKAGGAVGYGLGLTFCRNAVEAQGGKIWLTSDVGQGTTVTFTLRKNSSA